MEKAIIFVLAAALVGLLLSRIHFHFSFNLTISRDPKVNPRKPIGVREAKRRAEIPGEVPSARSLHRSISSDREKASGIRTGSRQEARRIRPMLSPGKPWGEAPEGRRSGKEGYAASQRLR